MIQSKLALVTGVGVLSLGAFKLIDHSQQHLFLMNAGSLDSGDVEFLNFIATYGKHYASPEEFNYRRQIFKDNLNLVRGFDSPHQKVRINSFSDLSQKEWKSMIGTQSRPDLKLNECDQASYPKGPVSVDWRNQGAITGVKDMHVNQCNNPWSFSSTAAVEFLYWKHTSNLLSLSE